MNEAPRARVRPTLSTGESHVTTETAPNAPLVDQYDVDKLPEAYRALLEPERPLPSTTLFFPRRRTWTSVVVTAVVSSAAVAVGLALVVLSFALGDAGDATTYSSSSFSGLTTVGLAFALGGGLWAWSVRTKVRGLRAERAGRPLRYGLFLTPRGALERRDVGYTLVPREHIRDVRLDEQTSARVVFAGPDGAERGLTLARDLGDPATLVDAIRRWLAT
jgi:hypothetical protein